MILREYPNSDVKGQVYNGKYWNNHDVITIETFKCILLKFGKYDERLTLSMYSIVQNLTMKDLNPYYRVQH